MQEECSFQLIIVQYEVGFRNENFLRVKVGYFKKSQLANCAKMRILKAGGTTIQMINRIPGSRLLISSLPGSALRTLIESLRMPRDVNKRSQSLAW